MEVTAGYYDENNNWVPPVFEDQGSWTGGDPVWVPNIVEISPGYWQDMWGDVFTGQTWIGTGGHTEIVGTHTELQSVQDPSYWTSEQIDYIAGGPPRIEFASTRSDANFVWQIPENDSAESPLRDVLVVSNGGLTIPSADATRQTHLYPTGLQQSKQESFATGSRTYSAESCAEVTKHTMSWVLNDGQYKTERSELLPGYLRFTKTEQVSAEGSLNTVTTRTSIAPASAQFGGVVTVEGNLRVQGALRVMPAGGLSMGEFTHGPTPTGN